MKTKLFECHTQLNAQMVDFAGWQMPMKYGSTIDEHHAVRRRVGIFDVSHMLPVDFEGPQCRAFLQQLLAGNVDTLHTDGRAFYTVMLNLSGGILDDLIVYRLTENHYRIIFNAGVAQSDLEWVTTWHDSLSLDVAITPRRDLNILAVQGPKAIDLVTTVLGIEGLSAMKTFTTTELNNLFIARTGYTGEDGVEILCGHDRVVELWQAMIEHGATPCGLGARDTLRLEAGMNLNGQDMNPKLSPFECGLGWVVEDLSQARDFIGKAALVDQAQRGYFQKLTGVVLHGGVMRSGYEVQTNAGTGVITSGSFSPTLGYSVALARLPTEANGECFVSIRNKPRNGKLVRPPFVRKGVKVHS